MSSDPPDPTRCDVRPRARPRQRPHGPEPAPDHDAGLRTAQALERLRAMLASMEERLDVYIDEVTAGSPPAVPVPSVEPDADTITVVVADGSERFRHGLVGALRARPGIRVVGEAADGPTTLALVRRLHPQVVLCDLRLPGADGVELVREITRAPRLIGVRVAVLAGHGDELVTMRARAAGANTSIDRAMTREEICDVVEALATG